MNRVRVLEDVPPTLSAAPPIGLARQVILAPKPWVVFPGSFSVDEPIAEVVEASRLAPELTFVITGRAETGIKNGHPIKNLPINVVLPGFLGVDVFDDLLREADVILGLTKFEGIQLSVCNEALGFGRPLVTSDKSVLREMFAAAAVFVDETNPNSIASGCRLALADSLNRSRLSTALCQERLIDWKVNQLSDVRSLLTNNN